MRLRTEISLAYILVVVLQPRLFHAAAFADITRRLGRGSSLTQVRGKGDGTRASAAWKGAEVSHGRKYASAEAQRRIKERKALLVRVGRTLAFVLSTLDAWCAVASNEYPDYSWLRVLKQSHNQGDSNLPARVYSKLFYFAKLRPRLLFSVGALVRALQVSLRKKNAQESIGTLFRISRHIIRFLQLCTPLQRIIDPGVGVGFGINFFAYLAGTSRAAQTYTSTETREGAWSTTLFMQPFSCQLTLLVNCLNSLSREPLGATDGSGLGSHAAFLEGLRGFFRHGRVRPHFSIDKQKLKHSGLH